MLRDKIKTVKQKLLSFEPFYDICTQIWNYKSDITGRRDKCGLDFMSPHPNIFERWVGLCP